MSITESPRPSQWHPGEEAMRRRLHVPPEDNPTASGLPMAWAAWMAGSPLVALGTVDGDDRVWTTVLGGAAGVLRPAAHGVLRVSSPARLDRRVIDGAAVWTGPDPVLEALFSGDESPLPDQPGVGGDPSPGTAWVVDHGERGRLVAGLAIDLERRMRVKIAGRTLGAAVRTPRGDEAVDEAAGERAPADVRVDIRVDESLGNCPKYVNRKTVWPHVAAPELISDSLPLPPEAVDLIGRSDLFFVSSRHGTDSMDTNHRGGPPGFVRVLDDADGGVSVVYPEYSGNRLFQTLGNVLTDPAVGITFPDVETGDVLHLTGRAEVLLGGEAATLLPHSTMAVRVRVQAARFVRGGLPFRGRLLEPSPYNPPVRRLACELGESGALLAVTDADGTPTRWGTATLIRTSPLTPTISRHTFRLTPDPSSTRSDREARGRAPWRAGQHIVLDFSAQLDRGWSHMRDHDPRSLNDDHVRSFTISSPPPPTTDHATADEPSRSVEFDLTVRRQGPATALLARRDPDSRLDVAVVGFGGGEEIGGADGAPDAAPETAPEAEDVVVVAGGVGITPFLAQARRLLDSGRRLHVLWSSRAEDLPLAVDVVERIDGAAAVITLFVTGPVDAAGDALVRDLVRRGVEVHTRRMARADVRGRGVSGRRRFFVCAGHGLSQSVLEWVDDEPVAFESFDY